MNEKLSTSGDVKVFYNVLDYEDFKRWIGHRWNIMKILLDGSNNYIELMKDVNTIQNESVRNYEMLYLKFLDNYFSVFDRQQFNDNEILRYTKSILYDLNGILYFNDKQVYYYAYIDYVYIIKADALVKKIQTLRDRIAKTRQELQVTQGDISQIARVTNEFEDNIEQYKSSLARPATRKSYSRKIALGNMNIAVIYLLEVHLRNLKITNLNGSKLSIDELYPSYYKFLDLHIKQQSTALALLIQNFIADIILQRSTKADRSTNVLDLLTPIVGEHSIIAVANFIIAAGDQPLDELATPDEMKALRAYVNYDTLKKVLRDKK